MGIPAYFSHIIKSHQNILKTNITEIEYLFLDSNSLIYEAISEDLSDLEIIKHVCQKIEIIIQLINPSKKIYIAFDGVAPAAKLKQQKERRLKNYFIKKLLKKTGWNSAKITPGTEFMKLLTKEINKFFKHKSYETIISCSDEIGEGEHKICKYIRDYCVSSDNCVIYGLDADLIMLGLLHLKNCKTIYLYRETPEFIKSLSSNLDPNKTYFLNLNLLKDNILKMMNGDKDITESYQKNRLYDYIFLCFLLGNDFLPHQSSLNLRNTGVELIFHAYNKTIKHTSKSIIYKNNIQWPLFNKLIRFLANQEQQLIQNQLKMKNNKRIHLKIDDPEYNLNILPQINRDKEIIINPWNDEWQNRYYQELLYLNRSPNNLKTICENYLAGLEWTFIYYTKGCINWRWQYNYNYAPLLSDLVAYIPNKYKTFVNENYNVITPETQLAYVLPQDYWNLLNKTHQNALKKNIEDEYFTFDWAFCKYFWEAKINCKHTNLDNLAKILKIK